MRIFKKILNYAIKCRKFQISINNEIKNGKFNLPIHLAFGHEFVSSLVRANFNTGKDSLLLTHRNIHFTSIFSKFAKRNYNFFKKKNFLKNKNYGSMNYSDDYSDIRYTSSILGNNLAVACGIAETIKNTKSLVVCVTGDGAIEEGAFYESLILAKSLNLKIIFVVENNNLSMATTIKERRCNINLKKIASSVNVDYFYFKRLNLIFNIKQYEAIVKKVRENSNPVICEFNVTTLGSIATDKKVLRYHHGPMELNIKDSIFIKKNNEDILYFMTQTLGNKNDY